MWEECKAYHGCHTPHVGTRAPFRAQNYLWGAVLAGLDIVCEVVAHPTGVAQVGDLDGYHVSGDDHVFLHLGFRCAALVQGDASNVLGQDVAGLLSALSNFKTSTIDTYAVFSFFSERHQRDSSQPAMKLLTPPLDQASPSLTSAGLLNLRHRSLQRLLWGL